MHEIRIRTPAAWWTLAAMLITLAFLVKPMEAKAAAGDITVTMDVEIALSLDKSDPTNKKMKGEGTIYGACENGETHGFVRASVPETLTMTTPAGNKTAPAGTMVEFVASINARKGRANYEALNGLSGKNISDLMKGKVKVTVPLTEDFLDYGAGDYSLNIPVTFTMTKAYGSYAENLDFTPWETLLEEGKVKVTDGKLTKVEKGDLILEIDPSITNMGTALFSNSTYKEVVVPSSVTTSDSAAVAGSVETVVFEDGFTRIPDRICEGAANLSKVTMPDEVEAIGKYAFSKCASLTGFPFPTSLNYLGTCTFQKCAGIEEMTVYQNLTLESTIGTLSPFYGAGLKKITFKEGVTKIPASLCYNGCSRLSEIKLPTTLETIGQSAFPNATNLKEITIRSNISNDYGTPFSGSGLEKITFVDGITSIPKNLFNGGCSHLTDLYIPKSVTKMGGDAFKGCESLTEITIKNNVTVSGTVSPFRGSGIRNINFTEDVTAIPKYLFEEGCDQLEELDFPAWITKVEPHAFGGADSLEKVTVRSDMAEAAGVVSPFYEGDVKEIVIEEGVTEIPRYFFGDCVGSLTTLSLPQSLETIGVGAFKGCASLASLDLPEGVATIEGRAFEGCTSLKSLVIKRNITFSGSVSPFHGSGIENITFRNGVTEIPNYMFVNGCGSLQTLYLPASIQTIGTSAFAGCASLTDLVIRSDVSIPGVISPFSGSGLTSISFENGVTKIPGYLFDGGCAELTSLYIPASVQTIGSCAFKGCSSLEELTIRSDITISGVTPFGGNTLETLTISSGVTYIADFFLDGDCASLETVNLPVSIHIIGLHAFNGGEHITIRYAGTEAEWASVYRSEWEPYAIVYGAAQPALTGAFSMGNPLSSSALTLGQSVIEVNNVTHALEAESEEPGAARIEKEEPDEPQTETTETDALPVESSRSVAVEKHPAVTPSSVPMFGPGENEDGR